MTVTRKDALVRHKKVCQGRKIGKKRNGKRETCGVCGETFASIYNLRRHARNMHSQMSQTSEVHAKYLDTVIISLEWSRDSRSI